MCAAGCDKEVIVLKIDSIHYIDVKFEQLLVGASLSEPHTSVTALHTCVCVCLLAVCLLAWTDHLL